MNRYKKFHPCVWSLAYLWCALGLNLAATGADLDEFKIKRQDVFEFSEKVKLIRDGDRVEISFASKGYCDATVAIEDNAGKIVRHLASGVLGANAPEPFKKNALKQVLQWDGKDDQGKYLDDAERHAVRVSLGLKAQFERTLFWEPKKRVPFGIVNAGGSGSNTVSAIPVACEKGVLVFDSGSDIDSLRLFDHQGRYERTIYPFPAEKLDAVSGLKRYYFPQTGQELPFKNFFYGTTLLTSGISGQRISGRYALHSSIRDAGSSALAVAALGERIALVEAGLNRLAMDGSTGGLPLEGPQVHFVGQVKLGVEKSAVVKPRSAAFSPDGKWLYLTGYQWHALAHTSRGYDWLPGVVRVPFEGTGAAEVFVGSMKEGEAGNGERQLNVPTCVACDSRGRVLVGDYMNDRIQVFEAGGKFVKSIPVRKPGHLSVHQKTGELWVFSWFLFNRALTDKDRVPPRLTVLGGIDDPRLKAEYELPLLDHCDHVGDDNSGMQRRATLDTWTEPPTVWLVPGGAGQGLPLEKAGLRLLTPKDGKLVEVGDFGADVVRSGVRSKPPSEYRQRLYVNPSAPEKLYVGEGQVGVRKAFTTVVELDVAAGKAAEVELPVSAEEMAFDMEGHVCLRTGGEIVRFDASSWREVPWDYGEERMAVFCEGKGLKATSALVLPTGVVVWHLPGMYISVKGNLAVGMYASSPAASRKDEKVVGNDKAKPYTENVYPGRPGGTTVHLWDKHGKLICRDAVTSWGYVHGLALDKDDNLYLGTSANRVLDGKPYPDYMAGTLVKVKAKGVKVITSAKDHVLLPLDPGAAPKEPPQLERGGIGSAWAEGAEWFYGGAGFSGNNASHEPSACSCWNSRAALDFFARSFVPEVQPCSIAVLDTQGNLILRVGRYGNVDDGKPLIAAGGPPVTRSIGGDEVALFYAPYLATLTDQRLYAADPGNSRILSVKLGYHAEERVALKDVVKR